MGTGKHRLDKRKCLATLLYVSKALPDRHAIMKAIYIADKCHLERYGRLIYADAYRAMTYGPVPSRALDTVKVASGERPDDPDADNIRAALKAAPTKTPDHSVHPLRAPDMRFISPSEQECLDFAIGKVADMSFDERTDITHDAAWHSAGLNKMMPLESIIETLPNAGDVLDYVHNR